MKFALGADHKGFAFKNIIKSYLLEKGYDVEDFGTFSDESTDYSDYGLLTAEEVSAGKADAGVLICWTGNGMAITANKVKGIRAGLALSPEMAQLMRSHNDANVLVLSGKYTPESQIKEILDNFVKTKFEGGRHERRLSKIKKYEDDNKC